MPAQLGASYLALLDRARYSHDSGTTYAFLHSLIRSILQAAALAALDSCYYLVDDIEQTTVPGLAASLLSPSDGAPGRILDTCIPLLNQARPPACKDTWFRQGEAPRMPLNRRTEAWVRHRNDHPGHGVVAQDTIHDALVWLPKLAQDLLQGLEDLLPEVADDGSLRLKTLGGQRTIQVLSLRLHEDREPVVIRSIAPRGPSWRVSYQSLDTHATVAGTYELAPGAPLIALTRLEQRLYRSITVDIDSTTKWKPLALLPARQAEHFEGRQKELSALESWMNDVDSRACNVFGDGGIGKTTLVLEYLNAILSGHREPPLWRPDVICFFSAKETRWGLEGLQRLRGVVAVVEDAAREMARSYQERLDKAWFEGDERQIIDRAATLMSGLGSKREALLLVLDNAETLARSTAEEEELGQIISYMARRLCRVLVTSRRREKIEAHPIEVPPLTDDEGARVLRRLGKEYSIEAFHQAGDSRLAKVSRQLSGRPLLLDVVARVVGKFGYSIDSGVENTVRLAAGDLGTFLFEDAWTRLETPVQHALLIIGQLGGTVSGDVVGWVCVERQVAHPAVLSAFEETRFGKLLDYGAHYDLLMDPGARVFLAQKFSGLAQFARMAVTESAARVQGKYRQWLHAQVTTVNDRVAKAFRTEAAKAAHSAAEAGREQEAIRWYEEAIQADRGNFALLDRFAWYLMKTPKDLNRAIQVAREACSAGPKDADAHFTAGMIWARMANVANADEMFDIALRLGKPEHLGLLQKAYARSVAADGLLSQEPVDVKRVASLLTDAYTLASRSALHEAVTSMDSKHAAERDRTVQRVVLQTERLNRIISRQESRRA